jgi:hypothetical protein
MPMRRPVECLRAIIMFGLVGCADKPSGQEGGSLATWRIDSVPILDIGARDDDTIAVLGRPHSVAMVEESLVVVGDYEFEELRYFTRAGALVRVVGRDGDGPGEFRSVSWVHRCGDSLHVSDLRRGLMHVYGPEGSFARTYADEAPTRAITTTPVAIACNGRGLFIRYPYAGRLIAERPTTLRPIAPFWLSGPDGKVLADLGDFPGQEWHVEGANAWPLPMGRIPVIAIGDSRAYVGTADSSTIMTYRLDGTLISAITVPFSPRAATESDLEWYKHVDTVGQDPRLVRSRVGTWTDVTFPHVLPAYTALLVDAMDLLWVREYPRATSRTVRWVALSATGALVGSVELPVVLEVSEIGADYVLGIEVDLVTSSQRVRAYRLHR